MVISLAITLYGILRSQPVQTLLVQLTADYLSEKLDTEIRIKGFDISRKCGLVIEGISVLDQARDTLLNAGELGILPGKISLTARKLNIARVTVQDATFQLLTHKGDSILNLQHILDHFASTGPEKPQDTTPSKPWDLSVSSVRITNTRFHLQDENEPPAPAGMDYTNLDVSGINLEINKILINGDTIDATISHLQARERCGIVLQKMKGDFRVGPKFLKAHNLYLLTERSELNLDFDFLYGEWNAYNDFLEKVTIVTQIEPSLLDLSDIGFFAPELAVMKDRIRLSGNIRGTVSNFKADNLKFAFGQHTRFNGHVSATGLPNVEETFVDLDIRELVTSAKDIESFLLPTEERRITLPSMITNAGTVSLSGSFTGFYNNFASNLKISTPIGKATADLTLMRSKETKLMGYRGQLALQRFDIGTLTDNSDLLGAVTLRADLNGSGMTLADADLQMNVVIDTARINHYNYHNLSVSGILREKQFDGKLEAGDRNLKLKFNGMVNLRDSIPDFDFSMVIDKARLFDLHLLDRDSVNDVEASLTVKLKGSNPDNMDGRLDIRDLVYTEGEKKITLDHLGLLTRQDTAGGKSYHLQSDFADADITGRFTFSSLIPSISGFIRSYLASFSKLDTVFTHGSPADGLTMHYDIHLKQTEEVTNIFLPFLKIAPNTTLKGFYSGEKELIMLHGRSPAVFVNNIELSDWFVDAENTLENLSFRTGASHVYLKKATKTDSVEVKVDSFRLQANLRYDSILYHAGWVARDKPSELVGYADFDDDNGIRIQLNRFRIFLNEKYWEIDPSHFALIDTSTITLRNLQFSSGEQILRADGIISERETDTLSVFFNKVDISKLDQLIGNLPIDIDGYLNGSFRITNPYHDISIVSDLQINKFRFNRESLGDASLQVKYNALANRFDILSQIIYTGNAGTSIPFSLSGNYFMDDKNPHFDFDLNLKNLNLKMAAPFVSDFMTIMSGLASGDVKIKGNFQKPDITGQIKLMRTQFKINYLNVPYSFADAVTIDNSAIVFDKITLFDTTGKKAVLNGKIHHDHFSDLRLDLNIDMDDFAAFSNTRAQNSVFYGKARAGGNVSITGPPDDIRIAVRASSGGETHVVIPIDLTRSIGHADYMIFVEPRNDTLDAVSDKTQINNKGLSLDLGLRVNQDAVVEVFFPEQLGNLKASGTGNLRMTMTPETPFTLSGIYTLTKGSFLFQFRNLLRLPMSIKEGSTISWTGDAADANVSISTVYKLKAPLKGLTTDPDIEGVRIPVECIVRLSGKLMNPDISFAINLPNVEEGLKNLVYASIDTNNAVTTTEQTIYLMVMNQFKPVVATSTSVDVGATSMSLVTNQINSMLSQITSNVNVNMNYKPGTSSTSQEFDVGISTQLLNDRLLIDGTFGMNNYSNSTVEQSSTIVGDINIEYILTKNRRWRVRAFNRTNTLNILNNNSQYTQGVGIKYQRDFANFGELFRFGKKKDAVEKAANP